MSYKRSTTPRILIDDDSNVFLRYLGRLLRSSGFDQVVYARNGEEATTELGTNNFDLAIVDVRQAPTDSMEVLRATQRRGIGTAMVILAERGSSIEQAVEAMREGAKDYITKPIEPLDFLGSISSLLERNFRCAHTLGYQVDAYLREHSGTMDMRLGDLCRNFAISSSYLVRIFRDHLDTTFKRRLNFHRVEKAKQLLVETDYPIYLIAPECGFRNHRRLAEVFKKALKISPTAYRRRWLSKKLQPEPTGGALCTLRGDQYSI